MNTSFDNASVIKQPICFQFKTSFSSFTVLQLNSNNLLSIEQELTISIKRSPHFFQDTPIIIDIEKIKKAINFDFARLKNLLHRFRLVPMGIRGGSKEQQSAAKEMGLPTIVQAFTNTNKVPEVKSTEASKTKLISTPIRSGMQIYAPEGDLIIVGTVSNGAEILADGHIHIYGALRGRALAGAKGDQSARVFCQQLEAELISIAGYYLTKEDLDKYPKYKGTQQIYLENNQLRIEAI